MSDSKMFMLQTRVHRLCRLALRKENKPMGLTCKKLVGKQKSRMQKLQNELDNQKKAMKIKKGKK